MPSMPSLLKQLRQSYPQLSFKAAADFSWQPVSQTITYPKNDFDEALLLHELGHATLGHSGYSRDIELLGLEREAWTKARQLANDLGLVIAQDRIDDHLDTYRDWLHARSTCPNCQSSGAQISANQYSCPACSSIWHVNEARHCQLRRTLIK